MNAEVLFIEDCPHHEVAMSRLREAAELAGVDLQVMERQVRSAQEAAGWSFGGSPSILVDGQDLFPTAPVGELACRVYRAPGGRFEGAPSVEQLVQALRLRLGSA